LQVALSTPGLETNQGRLFLVNILGLANQGGVLGYSHPSGVINLATIGDKQGYLGFLSGGHH